MNKIKRWANTNGICVVSGIYCGDSGTIEPYMGDDWSEEIVTIVANEAANMHALQSGDEVELVIRFTSNGYDDPGQLTGPPEDCYPPEGDDEREISTVHMGHYRDGSLLQVIMLPKSSHGVIDSQFYCKIVEVEIERD
jgi:hypothetical protein